MRIFLVGLVIFGATQVSAQVFPHIDGGNTERSIDAEKKRREAEKKAEEEKNNTQKPVVENKGPTEEEIKAEVKWFEDRDKYAKDVRKELEDDKFKDLLSTVEKAWKDHGKSIPISLKAELSLATENLRDAKNLFEKVKPIEGQVNERSPRWLRRYYDHIRTGGALEQALKVEVADSFKLDFRTQDSMERTLARTLKMVSNYEGKLRGIAENAKKAESDGYNPERLRDTAESISKWRSEVISRDWKAAYSSWQKLMQDPFDTGAQWTFGEVAIRSDALGLNLYGRSILEKLLKDHPKHQQVLNGNVARSLARSYLNTWQHEEAVSVIDAAIKYCDGNAAANREVVKSLRDVKRLKVGNTINDREFLKKPEKR